MSDGMKKSIRTMAIGLSLSLCLTFALFFGLLRQYQNNSALGSASHLIEISRQGEVNVRSSLLKDQQLAESLADTADQDVLTGKNLLSSLEAERKNWGVDDLYVYTEDGRCVNTRGVAQNVGEASSRATDALLEHESLHIVKSQTEYAVAVNAPLSLNGSRVVAISVVHDLDTLIDGMGFRPFDGQGATYLTRQNGVRICQSGSGAQNVYNILTYFESGKLRELTNDSLSMDALMRQGKEGAFLFSGEGEKQYVVLMPVQFMEETLYLISVVPSGVVNQTQEVFSRDLMLISALMVLLMAGLFVAFLVLFFRRSRQYNADIHTRERLFDLLVSKTGNAFLLLEEGRQRPVYATSNARKILGDTAFGLEKTASGYALKRDGQKTDSDVLEKISAALSDWDGTQAFNSGYLPYRTGPLVQYLRFSLYPAGDAGREYIGIAQDVTPDYQREQSLREALTLADSANHAKTQFLSSVSHDIRTPLNAIINMARFLRVDLDDRTKAEEEVGVIQQASEHLLGLVNDVLDMSRIESGRMSFAQEPFQMRETLDAVCEMIRPLCEKKQQKFTCVQTNLQHTALIGDAQRLGQILINLLNNAMKFTPQGGQILFSITELAAIAESAAPYRFEVRDTGIGIPSDRLDDIFRPFSRCEEETVQKTEGTGLGLAITKNFVEAMGGTICVSSEVGVGFVFAVELSYTINRAGPDVARRGNSPPAGERFDGRHVLVAEDNAINRSIAEKILASWGLLVDTAENGQVALERYLNSAPGYYDMIYLDIRMPVLNGYQAAEAIRASGRADARTIPIAAMTANAFAEDVERARAAGMNAHVAKPIDPDKLHRVTGEWISGGPIG